MFVWENIILSNQFSTSQKNSNSSYFVPRYYVLVAIVSEALLSSSYFVLLPFCPQAILSSSHSVRRYTVRRHYGSRPRDFVRTPLLHNDIRTSWHFRFWNTEKKKIQILESGAWCSRFKKYLVWLIANVAIYFYF